MAWNLLPIRFIDDAFIEGVHVVIMTTYSIHGEKVARSVVEKLGADGISKIQTIGVEEVKQSFYGQLVFGKGVSSSLDEQLAKELYKADECGKKLKVRILFCQEEYSYISEKMQFQKYSMQEAR